MTAACPHSRKSTPSTPRLDRAAPAGAVAPRAATAALWAVVALLAVTPAQAQTVTIEKIPGEDSFDSAVRATSKFRIRARGSNAPWSGTNIHEGITVGVEFDYEGRDVELWESSNYTKATKKVSRFEVVLSRTPGHEAADSVLGNRIWDLIGSDMGNRDLHLIGPVIVRLYDPPGGRTYSLGSSTEICLVINESDGTAGAPCSSSQRRRGVLSDRLTARFDSLPDSHDGQTAFSFRIQFSKDIDATVDGMRDHALTVSGGTVTGAARVNKRDDLWSFTITPSGDAKVEIVLAGGASCTADGAICTSDGRQLSTGLLTFVSGPLPTLSIQDAVAYEGVNDQMEFSVLMDRGVTERSWFDYATADGTAEAGSDYTAKSGQLWYLGPGDTGNEGNDGEHKTWLIQVPIIDDTVEDDGETFTVTLSNPKGVTIGRGVATGTIRNSEDPVEISIADAEASEGRDGWIRFRLSLNHVAKDVTVEYATADGTATAGVDYVATSGSVVIRSGTINTEIAVRVVNDAVEDDGETFTLTLSNVSGAEIADGEAVGTIRDGKAEPVSTVSAGALWSAVMSVTDFGNGSIGAWGADKFSNVGGTGDLEATRLWYHTGERKLHLAFTTGTPDTTGLSLQMGDVAVAMPDGGGDSSFTWADVDVAWTGGETIPVRIARGGSVATPQANTAPTGLPEISGTARVDETLTASVSEIADADGLENTTFAFQWLSNNGTEDADIEGATNSTYTLVAADAGKTIQVRVTFTDDGETEETLVSAATDAVAEADPSELSVADAEAAEEEDDALDFVVTLDPAASGTVTVEYATADGTATAGDDYTDTSGTLTFEAGDTTKTVSVPISDDTADDGGETLTLTLSNASGAEIAGAEATGTIRGSEEDAAELSVADTEATEGEDTTLDFVVTLDPAASGTVTVEYATADGTATAGDDYTDTSGTLTFEAGDTTKTVSVPINDDTADDGGETLTLTLSNASGAEIAGAEATGTIRDPEAEAVELSVADAEATEGEDTTLDFVVTLDPAASETVTVEYATADGTATAGDDYTDTSGTLTFEAGDTTKTVSVPISDDTADDGGETLTLTLSNASGAEIADAEATGTIRNTEVTNTVATGAPTISGTPQVGETLTASVSDISDADGLEDASFAYQWLRGDADIQGATDSSYTLVSADEGETIEVRVTFSDDEGHEESLTSAATDTVAAAPNNPATGAPAISGTAQVDETLTASVSDISDADGLEDASFAYQWLRGDADIQGATDSSYTLVSADEGETIEVRVTFSDDEGHEESLTSVATDAVAPAPEPLTATFTDVPSEHAGEGETFTFGLTFSEEFGLSYKTLRDDDAFDIRGGEVRRAKRQQQGSNQSWTIHLEPSGHGPVTVTLPETTDCGATGAICTDDDRPLSHSLSATVAGPVGISVGDARVEEDDGAVLPFAVTLSRAASAALTVDYATSDGSAQAGVDYTAASGTLSFQAGESSKTIEVTVLDDSHDDDGETLTLTLSNPSSGRLADAEATGTIENRDPLPRALLARFGRTAAVHVVEQVEERIAAPREPGIDGRFAGFALRPGMERYAAGSRSGQFGAPVGANGMGSGLGGPMSGAPLGRAGSLATPGLGGGGIGMASAAGPMGGMSASGYGMMNGGGLLQTGYGGDDLLTGSAFSLNRETRKGGILSFWSRGARSYFSGREGALSLGGDVRTTMFGADYAKGPLMTGLSLSHSRGLGEYTGTVGGQLATVVTGLYPWLGYKATDRVTVWGVAGYGVGGMLLTPNGGPALEAGLSMAMAAAGTRGELVAGGSNGFGLAFKADALWVGTRSDGVEAPGGRLTATAAAVTRFRTGLEGSRNYTLGGRLSLRPTVEVGLRQDGGDAETGAGIDVGGGLVVADASTGLAIDMRVRTLLVHQAEGFSERGVSVSVSYNPRPSTPLGFVGRVAPSWGGQATSGASALWGRETMAGMAHGYLQQGNRLDGDVGYGLPVGQRFVGTPRVGFSTSEYGQDYRVGYGLGVLDGESLTFNLEVEAQRRNSPMLGGTSNGLLGQASVGW